MRNEFELRHFTVTGSGQFPMDMLRYDNCWPYTSEDAVNMTEHGRRSIHLVTRYRGAPTAGRWASFAWKCVDGH